MAAPFKRYIPAVPDEIIPAEETAEAQGLLEVNQAKVSHVESANSMQKLFKTPAAASKQPSKVASKQNIITAEDTIAPQEDAKLQNQPKSGML